MKSLIRRQQQQQLLLHLNRWRWFCVVWMTVQSHLSWQGQANAWNSVEIEQSWTSWNPNKVEEAPGQHVPSRHHHQQQQQERRQSDDEIERMLQSATTSIESPWFYDLLRVRDDVIGTVQGNVTSGIYKATVSQLNNQSFRLADIKTFLPFSADGVWGVSMLNDGFTALLATYHFNNRQLSPVLTKTNEFDDCDIRLTMELFDTEFSAIETTRTFARVLQRQTSFSEPPPAAVVGAFSSTETSPLAILTGVNNIPQVSHASTAVDFDVKEQFPLFGRTVTNTVGEADVALALFQHLGAKNVVILFVTDTYGSALQKGFQDAATEAGIETESVAFSSTVDLGSAEAKSAIDALKQSQYRYVYAILYDSQFEPIMTAAVQQGAVGPDYLYIFPGLDVFNMQETLTVKADSPFLPAYQGAGIIMLQGEVTPDRVIGGSSLDDRAVENTSDFAKSWKEALHDPEFVDYVRATLPESMDDLQGFNRSQVQFFSSPGAFRPFLYDAVTALGISMCRAGTALDFPTGPDIYEQFRILDLQGTSGDVKILNLTGTRDYTTISFTLWNLRVQGQDDYGNAIVEYVPSMRFADNEWVDTPGNAFQYYDGSTVPPLPLPAANFDYNYIGERGRIAGYTLMSITILTSVVALVWLFYYRETHVVHSSQPLFLFMVSIGAMVMASTIIPLSIEDQMTSNVRILDGACMATPWLYILGTNVAYSALFAKTRGVYHAYTNPELNVIHVSSFDIFGFFLIQLLFNVTFLIVWTVKAPLEWARIIKDSTDLFGRNVESYGTCNTEDGFTYAIVLAVLNLAFVLVGNIWSYQSRNIETEYSESLYIGVSMAAILQAWTMGIPILIVVWDNPQARFYVESGIIFVTSQAIVTFIYLPKMLALRAFEKEQGDPRKAYAAFLKRRSQQSTGPMEDDVHSGDYQNDRRSSRSFGPGNSQDSLDLADLGKSERIEEHVQFSDRALVDQPGVTRYPAQVQREMSKSYNLDVSEPSSHSRPTMPPQSMSWSPARFASASNNVPSPTTSLTLVRKMIFGMGAVNPKDQDKIGGIRVIHNPRTAENLVAAGGKELSRRQLDYYKGGDQVSAAAALAAAAVDDSRELNVLQEQRLSTSSELNSPRQTAKIDSSGSLNERTESGGQMHDDEDCDEAKAAAANGHSNSDSAPQHQEQK